MNYRQYTSSHEFVFLLKENTLSSGVCNDSWSHKIMLQIDKKQKSTKNNHHEIFLDVKNANATTSMSHATTPMKPNLRTFIHSSNNCWNEKFPENIQIIFFLTFFSSFFFAQKVLFFTQFLRKDREHWSKLTNLEKDFLRFSRRIQSVSTLCYKKTLDFNWSFPMSKKVWLASDALLFKLILLLKIFYTEFYDKQLFTSIQIYFSWKFKQQENYRKIDFSRLFQYITINFWNFSSYWDWIFFGCSLDKIKQRTVRKHQITIHLKILQKKTNSTNKWTTTFDFLKLSF